MSKLNFSIALGLASENFRKGLNNAKGQLNGFARTVKSAMGMVMGAFAAGQIKAFSKECVDAYQQQMVAEQKLATIMQQRMNATNAEIKSILELTSAQQKLGVIGDEVQIAGAQQISTFVTQKSSLDALIPAMNNLLAQQKGLNATQGDAVNIGNLMGKVMQGQIGALTRVGITFDEAQAKVLKFGTEEQKAAMLAEVITQNVGNMNESLAQTDMGKIQQMNNILGDVKEQIGGAIAPIVAELAPKIAEMAQTAAGYVVEGINLVKDNFTTFVQFLVALFAGIKLTPFLQSWVANYRAAQEQVLTQARVATAQREALEQKVLQKKAVIAELEMKQTEVTGSKKLAIERNLHNQKIALAELETKLKQAQNVEQTANATATAASNATIWSASWTAVRTAGVVCWTTIKSVMISTGIGAIVMVVVFAIQKLVEWFTSLKVVQDVWKIICDGVKAAIKWVVDIYNKFDAWLDKIGILGDAIRFLINPLWEIYKIVTRIVGKWKEANSEKEKYEKNPPKEDTGGTKPEGTKPEEKKPGTGATTTTTTTTTTEKEPKIPKSSHSDGGHSSSKDYGSSGRHSGGRGHSGGGMTELTPAQQAAQDVAKALKEYDKTIVRINAELEAGGVPLSEAYSKQVRALQSLYDSYADAYAETKNPAYLKKMKELAPAIEQLKFAYEGQTDVEKKQADEIEKRQKEREDELELYNKILEEESEARSQMIKDLRAMNFNRDTTNDYKLTDTEKQQAQLEFNLDNAREMLSILREAADAGVAEAMDALNEAVANVESLDEALKLEKVKEDVKNLQKEIQKGWQQLAQQGWQSIEQTVNGISSMIDKFKDADASGWEKFAAVINMVFSIFQSVQAIMETINTIQTLTNTLSAAGAVAAKLEASATMKLAAARMFAARALIPGGAAEAAAEAGVMAATVAGMNAYSKGGIVTSGSPVGDFVPAWLNQNEMVLNTSQQNRLFRLASGSASIHQQGTNEVRFRIEGRDLRGVLNKVNNLSARS